MEDTLKELLPHREPQALQQYLRKVRVLGWGRPSVSHSVVLTGGDRPMVLLVLRGPQCSRLGGWSGLTVLHTLGLSSHVVCLSWAQALSNSRHPLGRLLRTLMLTFQATYSGIGANKHLQGMAQEEVKQHAQELWVAYR